MGRTFLKNNSVYILSFFFPILILLCIFVMAGIYPFGKNAILISDLAHQYIHFYSYFYDAIKGDNSLLYSWHTGFGGNFIGNVAYYTSSPFLWIILFFNKQSLPEAVLLIITLKLGFSSVSISYFIKKKFLKLTSLEVIIFSSFYALMGYSIVYIYHVMWLDGLIWLPLLMLATDSLINKKKLTSFAVILTILFISNFYISYMIGLFIGLYFIGELIVNREHLTRGEKWKAVLKFAIGTSIAACISAILTIPTLFQILIASKGTTPTNFNFEIIEHAFYLIYKFFAGTYDTVTNGGSPNIYIGTFVLILVPSFFLLKSIKRREKIKWGILLTILVLSMMISTLNIAWHAFDTPNWFPYRYSFLLSFIMFIISLHAYQALDEIKTMTLGIIFFFLLCIIFSTTFLDVDYSFNPYVNLIFIAIFLAFILLKRFTKNKRAYYLLIIYAVGELLFNTGSLYLQIIQDVGANNRASFAKYDSYRDTINELKQSDPSFYRISMDLKRSNNDSIHIGYSSFSYFSSMADGNLIDSLAALGFSTNKAMYNEKGSTAITDALFGLKYQITSDKIIENKQAMPLGYLVNRDLISIKMEDSSNPFELQNEVVSKLLNKVTSIFEKTSPENVEIINAEVKKDSGKTLKRIDKKKPIIVKYHFRISDTRELYTIISSSINEHAKTYVNNKKVADYPAYDYNGILKLGQFHNEKVVVELKVKEDKVKIDDELFYKTEPYNLKAFMEAIPYEPLKIEALKGNHLEGSITTSKDDSLLFLSIPWDDGWQIEVDDKPVKPEIVLGAFIGINLDQGTHEISLTFVPKGFPLGVVVSLLGILSLVVLVLYENFGIIIYKRRELDA